MAIVKVCTFSGSESWAGDDGSMVDATVTGERRHRDKVDRTHQDWLTSRIQRGCFEHSVACCKQTLNEFPPCCMPLPTYIVY